MKSLLNTLFSHDLIIPVLGICPLLVATTTLATGVAMGVISLLALLMIGSVISALRNIISYELRVVIILFVSATLVTVLHLGMQALFYDLSQLLGIYIPLIAMNCFVLANIEEYSLRNNVAHSFLYYLKIGIGIVLLLAIVGMIREIAGFGTLLQHAELLFGDTARSLKTAFLDDESAIPFFKLAPGAFFVLGLVIAFRNFMETRTQHSTSF